MKTFSEHNQAKESAKAVEAADKKMGERVNVSCDNCACQLRQNSKAKGKKAVGTAVYCEQCGFEGLLL